MKSKTPRTKSKQLTYEQINFDLGGRWVLVSIVEFDYNRNRPAIGIVLADDEDKAKVISEFRARRRAGSKEELAVFMARKIDGPEETGEGSWQTEKQSYPLSGSVTHGTSL